MNKEEIEKMFNGRFVLSPTTYDHNTFAPSFNFFDKRYQKAYSIKMNATDYDKFRIEYLSDIVKNDIETIRDEKINEILK
jgi:hypothetical protein